jgi:hypothetical protein
MQLPGGIGSIDPSVWIQLIPLLGQILQIPSGGGTEGTQTPNTQKPLGGMLARDENPLTPGEADIRKILAAIHGQAGGPAGMSYGHYGSMFGGMDAMNPKQSAPWSRVTGRTVAQ